MRHSLLLFLLLFLQVTVYGNHSTDSLYRILLSNAPDSVRAKTANELGFIVVDTEIDSARKIFDLGLKLAKASSLAKTRAALLINKGFSYYYASDLEQGEALVKKAVLLYDSINANRKNAYAYFILGSFRLNHHAYPEAEEYLLLALKYSNLCENYDDVKGSICSNLGLVYGYIGQRAKSIDYKLKAITYKEKAQSPSLANSIMNLGLEYVGMNDFISGEMLLQKAYKTLEKDTNKSKAVCLQLLAQLYIKTKNIPLADRFIKVLSQVAVIINDSLYKSIGYMERAKLQALQKDYNSSIINFKKAFELLPILHSDRLNIQICINYAQMLLELAGNEDNIQHNIFIYAHRGLEKSETLGVLDDQLLSLRILKDYYQLINDESKALLYTNKYMAIKDSIYNKEMDLAATDLKYKYETEKKELEIEILNKDNLLKEAELLESGVLSQRKSNIILAVCLGLFLCVIFVFLLVKQGNQRKKTNHDLMVKNKTIAKQNDEKELLLKEIHHRVKNNLQVVSSLLDLQSHKAEEQEKAALAQGQSRVKAMALIHEKLYQSKSVADINFEEYCTQLSRQIGSTFPKGHLVNCQIDVKKISLDIDTAIPIGLILNELITNAFKYAFPLEKGLLRISTEKSTNNNYVLKVEDSGNGMPDGFDWRNCKSLGLRLVHRLSKQLYGKVEYTNDQLSTFKITFKDTVERKKIA